jgi:hypothetical protein
MKGIPLRRSQLITTFGPGSLIITPEGEATLVGALDKWYHDINENRISNIDEYEVFEPRIKSILKVDRLLLPPDYRQYQKNGYSNLQNNTNIYIPLLRFPTWHYCPTCFTLHQLPMTSKTSRAFCKECKAEKKMIQVPFIIACEHGHLSDFPWREWVHGNENTTCNELMKLRSTGGATLDSLNVVCKCNKKRSLRGIMTKRNNPNDEPDDRISELSKRLNKDSDKVFKCPGHKPWFGDPEYKEECNSYPLALLKNSVNVYFANTLSAIYLPGQRNSEVEDILDIFEKSKITPEFLNGLDSMDQKIKIVKKVAPPLSDYEDQYIELAIIYMTNEINNDISDSYRNKRTINDELREKEYITLQNEENSSNLKIRKEWSHSEHSIKDIENYFELINRVTKLRETVVLTGFNRLIAQESNANQLLKGKQLLFIDPDLPENNWLPAFKVYGEGIFFTLNEEKLNNWQQDQKVLEYFNKISKRMKKREPIVDLDMIKPKSILLHTLSHIIIDQLALTCGYNTAAIQERLYVNEVQNGVLIYTSSGDIDGTFGGLVRMGKQEHFFDVVEKALEKAKWCSSDPVCSEIGRTSGQGVKSLNGAACHNCSYLPETSCELGNLFLDRTLLIDPEIGFFKDLIN